jgi:hypothetical protein
MSPLRRFNNRPSRRSGSRSDRRFPEGDQRGNRPLIYALNWFVIVIAYAVMIGLLLSVIAQAFIASPETGLKSIAAAALPPIVLTYSNFFSRATRVSGQVVEINLFVIAILWIVLLLLLLNLFAVRFGPTVPLSELVISLTLSGMFYYNRWISRPSLLSCAYGMLSGFLIYLLIFGLPS